jgi:hypothetical protein
MVRKAMVVKKPGFVDICCEKYQSQVTDLLVKISAT